jgi:solute:Na+ symporter, SSS family
MTDEQKAENRASYSIWDVVMSVVVVGIVVFVMVSFRG